MRNSWDTRRADFLPRSVWDKVDVNENRTSIESFIVQVTADLEQNEAVNKVRISALQEKLASIRGQAASQGGPQEGEAERETQASALPKEKFRFEQYDAAKEQTLLPAIQKLISADLSEPYSIYVYRAFLYQWGSLSYVVSLLAHARCGAHKLCSYSSMLQAFDEPTSQLVGAIICKMERHRGGPMRGYIAMLAVREEYRGKGIATQLVKLAIEKMRDESADEVCTNVRHTLLSKLTALFDRLRWRRRPVIYPPSKSTIGSAFRAQRRCIVTTSTATMHFGTCFT